MIFTIVFIKYCIMTRLTIQYLFQVSKNCNYFFSLPKVSKVLISQTSFCNLCKVKINKYILLMIGNFSRLRIISLLKAVLSVITAPALVDSENCSVTLSNWQVTATCSVLGMYASDNNYWCAWFRNNDTVLANHKFNNTRLFALYVI